MQVNLRSGILLIVLLVLFVPGAAKAGVDTLDHLVARQMSGDTVDQINIFRAFRWRVSFRNKDGALREIDTKRPDTIFSTHAPDTIRFVTSLYVTPALRNQVISLFYHLDGSLQVKVNGQTIVKTGDFQKDKNDRSHRLIQENSTDFTFGEDHAELEVSYLPYPQGGIYALGLALEQKEVAAEFRQEIEKKYNEAYGKGFYYLAFGIVFLILFIFFKEKSENLYFSLFCIFAALLYLWRKVELPFHFRSDILYNLHSFFGVFCFEFLSMFFCKILMNREKSRLPLLIIAATMALCFLPAIRYNYVYVSGKGIPLLVITAYSSLYTYTCLSSLYFLTRGVGKKQWEARAVLLFCFVPLLLFALLLILFAIMNVVTGSNQRLNEIFAPLLGYYVKVIVFVYPLAAVFILGKRNGMNQLKLIAQVESIRRLSDENLAKEKERQELLENQKESLEREVESRTAEVVVQKDEIERQHNELKVEKQKSDDLLLNILPAEVAEELKEKGFSEAKLFDNVTVLFADFVDFTKAGETMTPQELVSELHICFKAFDEIISRYDIEKIKTIGDAYLAVCGLPVSDPRHAEQVVNAAIEICTFMQRRQGQMGNRTFKVRLGVHSGSVVAGIVGVKKFAYDIWGDTVNTAARMEQNSEGDKINISDTTFELVKDKFTCTYRGEIDAKNKGHLKMYFVDGAITA